VLSGRGLCDELITRPEESYRLWCVLVCDLENLRNEEAMTRVGSQRHSKQNIYIYIYHDARKYEYQEQRYLRLIITQPSEGCSKIEWNLSNNL